MALLSLVRIACLTLFIKETSQAHHGEQANSIYCVLSSRNDSSLCPPGGVRNDLSGFMSRGTFNECDASFIFMPGIHHLNMSLTVENTARLSFEGIATENGENPVVECTRRWTVGLVFINVTDLSVQNINIVNCACGNNASTSALINFPAVFFQRGKNLRLSCIQFVDGAFSIRNMKGNISISSVTVISHLYTVIKGVSVSIGTSYLTFYEDCDHDPINLIITRCNFTFINEKVVSAPFSKSSAGLADRLRAVTLILHCVNVQASITKSQFSGFKGFDDGGNMAVILQNNLRSYQFPVILDECIFKEGHAVRGGAIYISLVQTYKSSTSLMHRDPQASTSLMHRNPQVNTKDAVKFSNTIFLNNSASFVGAAVCIVQKESYTSNRVLRVEFKNCTFFGNFLLNGSHGGIAIHILQFVAIKYMKYSRPQYNTTLQNCSIHRNFVKHKTYCSAGNGVIMIIRNSLFTIVNTTLTSNNCTAILAVGSNLVFEGWLNISGNNGSSGGGLMFCDGTVMFLKPHTHVYIANNSVEHAGGGICVDSQCLETKPMCFFQFTKEIYSNYSLQETIKIELKNNHARKYAGHNLFGGFVDRCFILDSPKSNKAPIDGYHAFLSIFDVDTSASSSVTSIPLKVCFCYDNTLYDCGHNHFNTKAYPGQPFNVPAVIVGQLNGTVSGSVRTLHTTAVYKSQELQKVPSTKCTNLKYTVISNSSHELITLFVDHDGDISAYLHLKLFPYRYVNVILLDCPVGFEKECRTDKMNYSICKCSCKQEIKDLVLTCSIKNQTITKPSSGWIGYIPDPYRRNTRNKKYIAVHSICPFDYCIPTNITLHSTNSSIDQDKECQFNRTGILCGACPGNLSVILGTSGCWKCSSRSLALIILFAVMGIVLVGFLTVSNFTVSEGTISGLIFYANVVQIGATNFFSPTDRTMLTIALKVFISWINLDFGISSCLYNGMDAYAKAWLQFVFPVYLWVLSGVIVFLCNRYISVTRVFRRNSVKVLSTVILLSFTKLLRSVVTTMSFVAVHLYVPETRVTRHLWLNDPNVLFLQGKHIILFTAGLLFASLCGIFFLYLFCIQHLQRFHCIQRIRPFTDCYTGPYTPSARFWTGLLLLSRVALLVASSLQTYVSCVVGVSASLLFIAHLIPGGLYSQKRHSVLESFFLLNLIILCIRRNNTPDYDRIKWSGSASFLVFVGLLIYHCSQHLKNVQCWISIKNSLARMTAPKHVANPNKSESADSNVPRYRRFDQDREPLLSSVPLIATYQ